jgi:hypothetical protein
MWTLIVVTIVSTSAYDYTRVTEVNNIPSYKECATQRFFYERRSPWNVGYCEKQPGDEKIKPRYTSQEYRKPK